MVLTGTCVIMCADNVRMTGDGLAPIGDTALAGTIGSGTSVFVTSDDGGAVGDVMCMQIQGLDADLVQTLEWGMRRLRRAWISCCVCA